MTDAPRSPETRDLAVWMINLDRSTDRRAAMEARIAALGAPFAVTRFAAVDGRLLEVDAHVDQVSFRRHFGRRALPGEVGCYLSHLAVWQEFLDSGKPVALVMEDDVVFHDDFLAALDIALSEVARWDMLKLNRIRAKQPMRMFRKGGYDFNAYFGPQTGTGAYLLTRETAARLLPRLLPIRMPIDHEFSRYFALDLRLIGLEPFPSHVADGQHSTITGQGFSAVQKAPLWQRLPGKLWHMGGYFGRAYWLMRAQLRTLTGRDAG